MCASQMVFIIAQVLLLNNCIAGVGGVVPFLVLYFIRVPIEEKKMLAQFGEKYEAYMARTGRVVPRFTKTS